MAISEIADEISALGAFSAATIRFLCSRRFAFCALGITRICPRSFERSLRSMRSSIAGIREPDYDV